MARLDNLPDETLLHILSYLTRNWGTERSHSNSDLYNTALVSHQLGDLVRPLIMRKVYLDFLRNPIRVDRFARSIQENPAIAWMVYDLDLEWHHGDQDHHTNVNVLLSRFQNLKILKVTAIWDSLPFEPTFLKSMNRLSHLTIEDSNLTTSSMSQYIFHDSLRFLEVVWVEERDTLPILPLGYTSGASQLRHLILSSSFHLAVDTLGEILKWPKALESLKCGQTGKDPPVPWRLRTLDWRKSSTPFSPASTGRALACAGHSLKQLCVFNSYFQTGEPHDSSKLDLGMMKELREVDAEMAWFFTSFEEREYFYKLLPPKVEVLKLHLGLIGNGVTRIEVEDGNGEDEEISSDLLWLMNIASNKSQQFPWLGEVHLDERFISQKHDYMGYRQEYWRRRWKPPRAVARAFQEADITLIAIVYKKNPEGPTCNPFYISRGI